MKEEKEDEEEEEGRRRRNRTEKNRTARRKQMPSAEGNRCLQLKDSGEIVTGPNINQTWSTGRPSH
jgi:hypothetical protein